MRWAMLMLVLAGCAHAHLSAVYDPHTDLSGMRTFAFAPLPKPSEPHGNDAATVDNSIVRRQMRDAIAAELHERGFVESAEHPDFTVAYYINARPKTVYVPQKPNYGVDYGYGPDNGFGYGFGVGGGLAPTWDYGYTFAPLSANKTLDAKRYAEGTIIVDVIDPDQHRLVWRGEAIRQIASTADENGLKVRKTISELLDQFPPKPKAR
jgi:hypothetical protein